MKAIVSILGLAAAISLGTVLAGWWTIPIVSAAWMYAFPRRGAPLLAAISGALGWGLLLLIARRNGPIGALDEVLSGTLRLPPGAGIALTLAYAALLAGATALLAQTVRGVRSA